MFALHLVFAIAASILMQPTDVVIHDHLTAPPEGPRAFVDVRHVDLGTLREGTVGTAVFKLENRGKSDLTIGSISASCGCTTVRLGEDEKVVPPGESRDIIAKFDSRSRLGAQRKVVTVRTNDSAEPMIQLTLSADVVTLFRVLPRTIINMRSVHRGESLEPLHLYPTNTDASLSDIDISVQGAALDHSLEPITGEDGAEGVVLNLSVPQRAELGPVTGTMTITATVGGEKATIPVRLAGSVVGSIVVRPVSLQSLALTPRGREFAPVTVATTTDDPYRIISTDAGPYIDVNVKTIKPDREFQIRTTLSDKAPDGPLATMLSIRTDNPTMPLIELPMFVNVRPRFIADPPMVILRPDESSRKVRIAGEPSAWKMKSVACNDQRVQVEMIDAPNNDPNGQYVSISLTAGGASSAAEDLDGKATVTITTDDTVAPQINIPVVLQGAPS